MPSVCSFIAQNVTKRIVTVSVSQLFLETDFARLEKPNTAKYVSKLGNSYIIAAGTELNQVLDGNLTGNNDGIITRTGTITSGASSLVLSGAGETPRSGDSVTAATGIPTSTTVSSVTTGGGGVVTVTLSAAATAALTSTTFTFTPVVPNKLDRFRGGTAEVPANTACVDMGKEIRIGYANEPDALVFRKVRVPPNPTLAAADLPNQTAYYIGYLLVDNKVDSELTTLPISANTTYAGYFDVTVARV